MRWKEFRNVASEHHAKAKVLRQQRLRSLRRDPLRRYCGFVATVTPHLPYQVFHLLPILLMGCLSDIRSMRYEGLITMVTDLVPFFEALQNLHPSTY